VSSPTAGPRCPRCRRPLAAWRLEHCIYCGEAFPPGLKDGFQEPETLKWVDRPQLPPDVSKKLELMKVVPIGPKKKTRPFLAVAGLVAVPIFAAIFYLTFSLLRRVSPTAGVLILVGGVGVLGYLVWIFARAARK
jgi:hypothetical protein